MTQIVKSASLLGIKAHIVEIEVAVSEKPGNFSIVGLIDRSGKESLQRIEEAILSAGFEFPEGRVTANLAPANVKKHGSQFDLPLALSILRASGQLQFECDSRTLVLGELSLSGKVRPVLGCLAMAIEAISQGVTRIILPASTAKEVSILNLEVIGVDSLVEAIGYLTGKIDIRPMKSGVLAAFVENKDQHKNDFSDVQGQEIPKRAMEIAVAGGHNAIMIGPPGAGKSMIAQRVPSIMPPIRIKEALELTCMQSAKGCARKDLLVSKRPFRAPHHNVTKAALVGGGINPTPGEISLAHRGVLFLDELTEFNRETLEMLRQPLEDRKVNIARLESTITFPSDVILIAAMNPCPCGYMNHPEKQCTCSDTQIKKYLGKISKPFLDRIDLHLQILPVSFEQMISKQKQESSETIRKRVERARNVQIARQGALNNALDSKTLNVVAEVSPDATELLRVSMEQLGLSARAFSRVLKVARTIADLAGSTNVQIEHVAEAIEFRILDRELAVMN